MESSLLASCLVIFLACLVASNAQSFDDFDAYEGNPHRIIGGQPVSIGQAPWQAAVYRYAQFQCGGSVISSKFVLTAAHCVEGKGEISVRAGSSQHDSGGQRRSVKLVVISGGYNKPKHNHNIALLRVSKPFIFGSNLRPVQLAVPQQPLPESYFVTGWGPLSAAEMPVYPENLRGVELAAVSAADCQERYKGLYDITRYMMCTAAIEKDTCGPDAGGALVNSGVQYGIVSFGEHCADSSYPGVNVDVRSERAWISYVAKKFGGTFI